MKTEQISKAELETRIAKAEEAKKLAEEALKQAKDDKECFDLVDQLADGFPMALEGDKLVVLGWRGCCCDSSWRGFGEYTPKRERKELALTLRRSLEMRGMSRMIFRPRDALTSAEYGKTVVDCTQPVETWCDPNGDPVSHCMRLFGIPGLLEWEFVG